MHAQSCSYTIKLHELKSSCNFVTCCEISPCNTHNIINYSLMNQTLSSGCCLLIGDYKCSGKSCQPYPFGGGTGDYKCSLRESYESDSFSRWHLLISVILKKAGLRDYSMTWHFYSMIGSQLCRSFYFILPFQHSILLIIKSSCIVLCCIIVLKYINRLHENDDCEITKLSATE